MTDAEILEILKCDLGIASTNKDAYLMHLISVAHTRIEREGISLTTSEDDSNLVMMYASYLWRKRADSNNEMPKMLRLALNNRLISQKGQAEE